MKAGLLLLSGGASQRMGAPKHALPHPSGASWGGHLVQVFQSCFPEGAIQILGEALPDRPELRPLDDPRQGPAVALLTWARGEVPPADRWWVVACDQVRWTPQHLARWAGACQEADPGAQHWVLARHGERLQPLGGWLPAHLLPHLAELNAPSLHGLVARLPHLVLPQDGDEWCDLDTADDRRRWEGEGH